MNNRLLFQVREGAPAPHWSRCVLALGLTIGTLAGAHATDSWVSNPQDRQKLEQALPAKTLATPAKPRRLLIFTLNVGYGGHPSILYANEAFALMGKRTGAYESVVSDDPAVFERANLDRFDAVFFNNTVGNCFTNAELRRNLMEFITGGGGLLGVHGTSVAFTRWPGALEDWPEFGFVIGGRGANHKESNERVWVKVEQPGNPLTRMFGAEGFEYRDEFFRVHEPYSRERVRVLLSIDTAKTDLRQGQPRGDCVRADNDYALAWVRQYGRGRAFYCTIAHNNYVFQDPRMLEFYLAAIQFALGDLTAPTLPSARLTPAARAQESLGWRLGLDAPAASLEQAIAEAQALKLAFMGASGSQKLDAEGPKDFGPELSEGELEKLRLKLDAAGLRLLTYQVQAFPEEERACTNLFEFARKMGVETLIGEPKPELLPALDKLCQRYGISLALLNRDRASSPRYCRPDDVLDACGGLSMRMGACADVGAWLRSSINPVKAAGQLKRRLLVVRLHDLNAAHARGADVVWGAGAGSTGAFLNEVRRLGIQLSFSLEQPAVRGADYARQSLDYFNQTSLKLAPNQNERP